MYAYTRKIGLSSQTARYKSRTTEIWSQKGKTLIAEFDGLQTEVTNVDQQFFKRYLALTESQRRVVRDVVGEIKLGSVD
jgi:hypothetical protein